MIFKAPPQVTHFNLTAGFNFFAKVRVGSSGSATGPRVKTRSPPGMLRDAGNTTGSTARKLRVEVEGGLNIRL